MNIVAFVLMCVLCAGMSVLSVLLMKKVGWQNLVVRGLTIFSALALVVTSSNLKELNNALTIFLPLALILILMLTIFEMVLKDEQKQIITSIITIFAVVFLITSSLSLAYLHYLAFLGGLLLGIGAGLIVYAIKKFSGWKTILLSLLKFAVIGVFIGCSFEGVISGLHLASSILMLLSGLALLTCEILSYFNKNIKIEYAIYSIKLLSILLLSMTIYFF